MTDRFRIIKGGIYRDSRGELRFVNDFDLSEVRRFYQITNSESTPKRAWQAHKVEEKWFFVSKGKFRISLVKICDWDNPRLSSIDKIFDLSSEKPSVLFVPGGYANSLEALEPGSILQVFSNFTLEDGKLDDVKFPIDYW